jgi:hypothetical protein
MISSFDSLCVILRSSSFYSMCLVFFLLFFFLQFDVSSRCDFLLHSLLKQIDRREIRDRERLMMMVIKESGEELRREAIDDQGKRKKKNLLWTHFMEQIQDGIPPFPPREEYCASSLFHHWKFSSTKKLKDREMTRLSSHYYWWREDYYLFFVSGRVCSEKSSQEEVMMNWLFFFSVDRKSLLDLLEKLWETIGQKASLGMSSFDGEQPVNNTVLVLSSCV